MTGFLQNEIGSGLKRFLRGRLSIHHGKSYRLGVALRLAQVSQQVKAILQIVAVDNDGVKLSLGQQIIARPGLGQIWRFTEIFSNAGRNTPSKAASRLMRRESRFMAFRY